jgi:predicted secreted hydrolase
MMRAAGLIVASAVCAALVACARAPDAGGGATDDGSAAGRGAPGVRFLGAAAATGFARATVPRPFAFPADHGSHDEFRSEWWYFTGNLDDEAGSHYGFELTFFRIALQPDAVPRDSAWGTNQVWMAHFALTDVARGRFTSAERFARGGSLGLAGASADPSRIWVKDWSAAGSADATSADLALSAGDGQNSLSLRLTAVKPPVAQGDRGLDAKGPEPGNASYYYSFPRLTVTGTLEAGGDSVAVRGSAWMDREWGTSALSAGVVGWDWFALQLSDGRDLMFYRLRDATGNATPFSGGSIVDASGVATRLTRDDARLTVVGEWRSDRTGVTYPVAWRLELPAENLSLEIVPFLENQEVDLSVRYWEGAVRARGSAAGTPVTAQGYLELAGY